MTDYERRIRSAVLELREFACSPERLTIFVSPDVLQKMVTEWGFGDHAFEPGNPLGPQGTTYLGLALAVDGDYPSDTIALRFEVKA